MGTSQGNIDSGTGLFIEIWLFQSCHYMSRLDLCCYFLSIFYFSFCDNFVFPPLVSRLENENTSSYVTFLLWIELKIYQEPITAPCAFSFRWLCSTCAMRPLFVMVQGVSAGCLFSISSCSRNSVSWFQCRKQVYKRLLFSTITWLLLIVVVSYILPIIELNFIQVSFWLLSRLSRMLHLLKF